MGLQAEALDDFNLAVSLDPENSDIYHHKGQVGGVHDFSSSPVASASAGMFLVLIFTN